MTKAELFNKYKTSIALGSIYPIPFEQALTDFEKELKAEIIKPIDELITSPELHDSVRRILQSVIKLINNTTTD